MPNTLLKLTTWRGKNLVSVARYNDSNGSVLCVWVGTKLYVVTGHRQNLMHNVSDVRASW